MAMSEGFTLIEVVVAVALLGLILAASFGLLGIGLGSLGASREYTKAVILARQKLQQAALTNLKPGTADQGAEGGYRWNVDITPEENSKGNLPAQIFRLRAKISWTSGAKERGIEMITLSSSVDDSKLPAINPASADRPLDRQGLRALRLGSGGGSSR
jgi:prepilin-type N-terminal cleavage/methylation domain-containing protein